MNQLEKKNVGKKYLLKKIKKFEFNVYKVIYRLRKCLPNNICNYQ